MKIKRGLFIVSLIALFISCFVIMNQYFDELARYPYDLTDSERETVLTHLDAEEINFLVSQKIKPEQFLPFLKTPGFDLNNTLWYTTAYQTQIPTKKDTEEKNKEYIVRFINRYHDQLTYPMLKDVLTNYTYNVLTRFFDEKDVYLPNAQLIATPSKRYTWIKEKQTLFTYEPKDLVAINDLPHQSLVQGANDILIKKEVVKPLQELCSVAKEINQKTCGDMRIVAGYIPYENQITIYEKGKELYGDKVSSYWDVPGRSEYQLGYSVQLLPNEIKPDIETKKNEQTQTLGEKEREQEIWLKDNAYKYGFVIRFPKGKEYMTGKIYQPYTLRYVGKEMAKKIHDDNLVLEEVNVQEFEK